MHWIHFKVRKAIEKERIDKNSSSLQIIIELMAMPHLFYWFYIWQSLVYFWLIYLLQCSGRERD
jgi:hypothetical protein